MENNNYIEILKSSTKRAVGTNSVIKAIENNEAERVFIAKDIDSFLNQTLMNACEKYGVKIIFVDTREQLASLVSVSVKTATAAILK